MFEIKPTYTKQGTLDGMIGFTEDRKWVGANGERGSYFKPKEVNNLVKQIEADEADLAARYTDFNPISLGQKPQSYAESLRDPLNDVSSHIKDESNSVYDWVKQVSKRNIVNTYVWTADSGFFSEQHQTTVVREESLGGSYSMKFMGGVGADFKKSSE